MKAAVVKKMKGTKDPAVKAAMKMLKRTPQQSELPFITPDTNPRIISKS
jgi:hypothetical protein